ncbi:MAG: cytochrome c biogenesis protein ResB [bacterium]
MKVLRRIFGALTSARLAVVVMAVLAALSLAGAMLPQGGAREQYAGAYGRFWGGLVVRLGLDRIFGADYYAALLVFLCVMVLACSLKGLPGRVRAAGSRPAEFDEEKLRELPVSAAVTVDLEPGEASLHVADALKRRLYSVRAAADGARRAGVGSKLGFARYGTVVLHLSFIFLLAGGIALARFGHHDYRRVALGKDFPLQVGEARNVAVLVEDFDIEFDDRGHVSDYVCDLALKQGDSLLLKYTVRPNHPLKYEGREIYLSSFEEDEATPMGFVLAVHDSTGREVASHLMAEEGRPTYVDEIGAYMTVRGGDLARGLARIDLVFDGGKLESHVARAHLTRASDGPSGYQFLLAKTIPSLVVTLEVVREPGQWLVVVGLALLTVGAFSALYLSHRLIWYVVVPEPGGKSRVTLGARASRNREGLGREFAAIRRTLEELA